MQIVRDYLDNLYFISDNKKLLTQCGFKQVINIYVIKHFKQMGPVKPKFRGFREIL